MDPNRRISSLGRLSKVGTAQVTSSAKVQNTTIPPPPCTVTSNSSRSLHVGGGGPNSQSTNTPQSTSVISIKNQAHSSIEATSLSLSKPAVRLAYAGKDIFHLYASIYSIYDNTYLIKNSINRFVFTLQTTHHCQIVEVL